MLPFQLLRNLVAILVCFFAPMFLAAGRPQSDFFGKGTSDILWRKSQTGQVYLMPMSGGAVQSGAVVWTELNPAWTIVGTADFDGDGKADILWWNSDTGQVCVMLMNGTAQKASSIIFTESNTAWKIAGIADFNGDGNPDLLWRNSLTGQVYLMPLVGSAPQPGGIIWTEPSLDWQIVASADFSGDGRADILWRNGSTGQVFLMRTNGIGMAAGSLIYSEANLAWQIAGTGDFDGDGHSDILWRNSVTGQVYAMPMKGGQPLNGAVVWTEANPAWQIVASGDFDGDGKDDILWWNATTGRVFLLTMNGLVLKSAGLIYTEADTDWRIQPMPGQAEGRLAFDLPGGVRLDLLAIPGGSFTMGSPATEVDRSDNEGPAHAVSLSRFYMGKFTVTQAQWTSLMGSNPSFHAGDPNRPVEQVSHIDITQGGGFLDKLNAATAGRRPAGMIFRLPTEAEWEYAARGGTSTRFYWGDDPGYFLLGTFAWWNGNGMWTTHGTAAGDLKPANPYGLYNMAGNVWEWCQDWQGPYSAAAQTAPEGATSGVYRVCRGGDYSNLGSQCRVAYRSGAAPEIKGVALGLRVVLAAPLGFASGPTGLTYAVQSAIYSEGVAISPNVPSNDGGAIQSYQVSPSLPAGLALDPVSGVISGTPTALTPATSHVVTGSNGGGSATTTLTIAVTPLPVIASLAASPASIAAGQAASLSWTVAGATTVTLSPAVGTVQGSSVTVFPLATTTYVLTAANPAGSVTASVTVQVAPTSGTFYLLPGAVPLEMVPIPGGTFTMGSPGTELDRFSNEGPQHLVTLNPFAIGRFTVTQAQWLALMGSNPSSHSGDPTRPVEQVSHLDISQGGGFLDKLNAATADQRPAGSIFRLPTEAEWEYAARGGTTTRFYWGDDPGYALLSGYAWWNGSGGWTTHGTAAAELKPANPYGLYNMTGNVWEWCQDWQGGYVAGAQANPTGPDTGIYRTCRGGDYSNFGPQSRVAYRSGATADVRGVALGLRVVLADPRGISAIPTGLSYNTNPAVFSQWVAAAPNVPANAGGLVTSYRITPALPAGLGLDPATGVISGTPTVLSPSTRYTVTGSNSAGGASVTLTIAVTAALPVINQFSASPSSIAAGQEVALSWSVTGATSLGISPGVGTVLGSSVVVYPLATTTYLLTATNSNGNATASVTVQATPPAGTLYLLPGAIPLELLPIPGGSFLMGSPATEVDRSANEGPQHSVTLNPFAIGKFTVSQAQWAALMGNNPSSHTGDSTRPVEEISYDDITQPDGFLDRLNAATAATRPSGTAFRLPTEAEWEYAARGGTSTRFYWGDDPGYAQLSAYAWWNGNALWTTRGNAAGDLKPANPYGLYNMVGNVWQWCLDWQGDYDGGAQSNPIGPASGTYRTCRGGDYSNLPSQLRLAYRSGAAPEVKGVALGLRVVLGTQPGVVCTAAVAPSILDFGPVPVGTTSAVQYVTITNTGSGSLTPSPALCGLEVALATSLPATLAPGASCLAGVVFKPTGQGTYHSYVGFWFSELANPLTVAVSGTGTPPAGVSWSATVAPSSLSFGSVPVGTTSVVQYVTITNTGTAALTPSPALCGLEVALATGLPATLAPGASCQVGVVFKPTGQGYFSSYVGFWFAEMANPLTVSINGTGTPPAGVNWAAVAAPASLAFGSVQAGSVSAVQYVLITNTGTGSLTLSPALCGLEVALATSLPTTLAPGASCQVGVVFKPTGQGAFKSYVGFWFAELANPLTVPVSGTGTPSGVVVRPTGLTYSANPTSYSQGVAIPGNVPSYGGGVITSFQVSPALPDGLRLDSVSGVIRGTPLSVSPQGSYVVTGANAAGNTAATLLISVAAAGVLPPSGLSYSSSNCTYTVGVAIPANTPTVGGGAVSAFSVRPGLPAGLSLNPVTGVISGVPSIYTSGSYYTVQASNPNGSVSINILIKVDDAAPGTDPVVTIAPAVTAGKAGLLATTQDQGSNMVYTWNVRPGTITGGQGTRSITYTAGPFSRNPLIVQVTASNSGGSRTGSATASLVPAPDARLTLPVTSVYSGQTNILASVPLQDDPGTTFLWSITSETSSGTIIAGQGTAAIRFSAGQPQGTFRVSVTVQNRLSESASGAATVNVLTGAWFPTGDMNEARSGHRAIVLASGEVLATGSFYGTRLGSVLNQTRHGLRSAELYDPVTGTWKATGDMTEARGHHACIELRDGRVLVAGGTCVYPVEWWGSYPTKTCEIWNPASSTWMPAGSMANARGVCTATLLADGKVLVLGGGPPPEIYDPAAGTWAPLDCGTFNPLTATQLPSGKVLMTSGAACRIYDLATGTWTAVASMSTERAGCSVTLLPDGKVLVAGGGPSTSEILDPATGGWSSLAGMIASHSGHTAAVATNGRVVVAGGGADTIESYDPVSRVWTALNPSGGGLSPAGQLFTVLPAGTILATGGQVVDPMWVYTISNAWMFHP
jgi:formylglycine-generating enzyme required for sulfatase activity/WD40 repeat protein